MVSHGSDRRRLEQRLVAVALVRCGVGGAIALADCDRAAARRRPDRGGTGLAGVLVCPADPAASVLRRRRCC